MFSSEILEIVIGLIFIYLILSLLGTTINELIAGLLHLRGKNLKKSLIYMLSEYKDKDVFQKFINHPVFVKLRRNTHHKYPSYLSSKQFSKIMIESIVEDPKKNTEKIGEQISKLEGTTGKVLQSYWLESSGDLEMFKEKMEEWYDETQARTTGWYKRNIQRILLVIGFIIALTINADTLSIVKKLSQDSKARRSMVELAINQSQQLEAEYFPVNEPYLESDYDEIEDVELEYEADDFEAYSYQDIKMLNEKTHNLINEQIADVNNIMGMGWNSLIKDFADAKLNEKILYFLLLKFLGFTLTAFAISLGSNFWFDLMNKVIRNSGGLPKSLQKPNPK